MVRFIIEQKFRKLQINYNKIDRRQIQQTMSLAKFLNIKPKKVQQPMEIQNPERQASIPWVQKYRPNTLHDITYQDQVINSLQNSLKTGNLPHLLFYGPAGTGKTSAIIALSKQLFGPKFYKERVLELNASDQRGINVIRQKVKRFAQLVCVKNTDKTYPCPAFKIIILDEADLMTGEAQSALRRVIEDNSANTRFCIICNYVTKIIQPLSSRCVKFRFKPIPLEAQLQKLRFICTNQQVKLNEKQIINLLQKGDLRQSINSLQSFKKLTIIPQRLLPVNQQYGQQIYKFIRQCNTIHQVFKLGKQIKYQGYPYDEILNALLKAVMNNETDQRSKAIIMQTIGKAQQSLVLGGTEMPLVDVLTTIYYVLRLQI